MTMDFEPELPNRESPEISVKFGEYQLTMNWKNTFLRYFDEGGGQYDHVGHKMDNGEYIAIAPEEDLVEQLIAQRFPRWYSPIVDDATIQWFTQALERDLMIDQADPTLE